MGEWLQKLLGRSDVYFGNSLYMRRWRLVHRERFGLRLHHIARSDADRELHDHPFSFLSLILRGGYWEHTLDGRRLWYGPGSVVLRSAEALHRLELPRNADGSERAAWTLVVRGSLRRRWGFLTPFGWQDWEVFTHLRRSSEYRSPRPFAHKSSL